jgi:transcriptional regulator with XRE-family HTH domain
MKKKNTEITETRGARLTQERKQYKHLTRAVVARITGISARTIEAWETDARTIPEEAEKKLLTLYKALNIFAPDALPDVYEDWTYDGIMSEYKIHEIKKISKIGKYEGSFSRVLDLVPDNIYKIAEPEDIAELVDLLANQYQRGHNRGWDERGEYDRLD